MQQIPEPIIVLAGGFGTRLKKAVSNVPKPLAPVQDRTFLDFLMDSLREQGATRVILSLHHMAGAIIKHFDAQKSNWPFRIEYCVEHEPLGTGGAVRYAIEKHGLDGGVWVCNGDTWIDGGICEVNQIRGLSEPLKNWIGVLHLEDAVRYSRVIFDSTNRVVSFEDKKPDLKPGWIHAGITLVQASDLIKQSAGTFSLEKDFLSKLSAEGCLNAAKLNGSFIDIGTPEDYLRFQELVLSKKKSLT